MLHLIFSKAMAVHFAFVPSADYQENLLETIWSSSSTYLHNTGIRFSPCPKESNLASLLYQMEQCHGTLVVSNLDIMVLL